MVSTKRITMKQIAEEVGVSIGTVSAVVSGGSGKIFFSDMTRDRVLTAVERLGYTVHAQARSLRLGQSRIVGLALDDLTVTFLADLIHAIAGRLQRNREICHPVSHDGTPIGPSHGGEGG